MSFELESRRNAINGGLVKMAFVSLLACKMSKFR